MMRLNPNLKWLKNGPGISPGPLLFLREMNELGAQENECCEIVSAV